MAANRKSVVRSSVWLHPAFDERLGAELDIEVGKFQVDAAEAEVMALLQGAHVYQISSAKDELPPAWFATTGLLAHCPRLVCVSATGAGYDTVDVAACTAAGVAVVNQAGGNANSVAEHALGLMLALTKRIVECDRLLHRERGWPRERVMGREIQGKTLGLVGIGHVGTRVAALGRGLFGMTVLAYDPYLDAEEIARRGARSVGLDELLAGADFVSVHCPRAKDTIGMLGAREFARMKPGAFFLNTARGGIHDEAALHQALAAGHLAGAGLDVWETEPPPLDHPLLGLDTVIATHHSAGVTQEARRNMALIAAEQIVLLLRGERPPRLVNPEVWTAYAERFARILGRAPA